MSNKGMLKATSFVQDLIKHKMHRGGTVIDATMGNGYDTVFLYNLVGDCGKVYAFDIQEAALENTRQALKKENISIDHKNIQLIHDGHENIEKYVKEPIDGAMFNLGYLPCSDKNIVTKPQTTLQAVNAVLNLLKRGGILSIVLYYGHAGGIEEKNTILEYMKQLEAKKYLVMECSYINQENDPPIILLVEKK
ncbi:class I SAM-dependent methyltransferase [Clostridium formicaceticum]|uniref:16S rRNA (Cytosine(1402)-N(4))-methyltransferase n=1 Tax=Clostridium formicaceticum TaxID=1497 RepID=A0AAC9RLY9_9CLOT|nr:class I SAM-dependent methyltransferase [Clostridium formicaceticum]AOY77249.1 16S rRNA (cytosine(1402)-N(4))-methyltransferase [Clostridium formicaceticum]ARE87783.1 16S rRNA m(4)C1402 methyltransferase [Clostridium formicaceticum]